MSATRHNGTVAPFSRVVMVASLGGISAFSTVLAGLPADFPLPIVVVQHRARLSPGHHDVLVDVLARCSALPVRSVTAGACADEQGWRSSPGALRRLLTLRASGFSMTPPTRMWVMRCWSALPITRRPSLWC